jgi:hypothetical protein
LRFVKTGSDQIEPKRQFKLNCVSRARQSRATAAGCKGFDHDGRSRTSYADVWYPTAIVPLHNFIRCASPVLAEGCRCAAAAVGRRERSGRPYSHRGIGYMPRGAFNTILNMGIAAAKVALIRRSS